MNGLVFGNYRLCDGCSKGIHADHVNVQCQCDLCGPDTTTAGRTA